MEDQPTMAQGAGLLTKREPRELANELLDLIRDYPKGAHMRQQVDRLVETVTIGGFKRSSELVLKVLHRLETWTELEELPTAEIYAGAALAFSLADDPVLERDALAIYVRTVLRRVSAMKRKDVFFNARVSVVVKALKRSNPSQEDLSAAAALVQDPESKLLGVRFYFAARAAEALILAKIAALYLPSGSCAVPLGSNMDREVSMQLTEESVRRLIREEIKLAAEGATSTPEEILQPKDFSGPGVYRVYWDEGGSSVAAIGVKHDGGLWLAPSNWLAPDLDPDWSRVERVRAISLT